MSKSIRTQGNKNSKGLWTTLAAATLALTTAQANAAILLLQPGNKTVNEGKSLKLSMLGLGLGGNSYAWMKDGKVVSTSSSLTISKASAGDNGTYTCYIKDKYSTANCKPFTVSVNGSVTTPGNQPTPPVTPVEPPKPVEPPAPTSDLKLNSQPSSVTVYEGNSTTFNINASSSKAVTYSWTRNGSVIGNAASLTINNASQNNAGSYSCSVSDGIKTINCASFTLTVNKAVQLTQHPASATVYEGGSTTFRMTASGSLPLTYQWTRNGSVVATGSSFTVNNATTGNAGNYGCSVSDGVKTVNCNSFALTVNQVVRITQQPVSQMLNEGANASLSVNATGTGPLSYQWYFNGSAISGATSKTLSLAPAQVSNSGSYYVTVRNGGSSANSNTVNLSIAAVVKTGSALISWKAPTTRADGTALAANQIAGYELYHSADGSSNLAKLTSLNANELSIVVDDLSAGTHYFALATKDTGGLQSTMSSPINVTIK